MLGQLEINILKDIVKQYEESIDGIYDTENAKQKDYNRCEFIKGSLTNAENEYNELKGQYFEMTKEELLKKGGSYRVFITEFKFDTETQTSKEFKYSVDLLAMNVKDAVCHMTNISRQRFHNHFKIDSVISLRKSESA